MSLEIRLESTLKALTTSNADLREFDILLSPIPGAAPALFLKKFIGGAAILFSTGLLEESGQGSFSLSFFIQKRKKTFGCCEGCGTKINYYTTHILY